MKVKDLTSVQVFGKKVHIKPAPNIEYGEADIERTIIYINPNLDAKEYWATLLHEIFHICLGVGGLSFSMDKDHEESVVRCLEHGLADLLVLK